MAHGLCKIYCGFSVKVQCKINTRGEYFGKVTDSFCEVQWAKLRNELFLDAYIQTAHHLNSRLAASEIGELYKSTAPYPSGLSRRVYNVTLQTFLKDIRLNKVRC